MSKFLESLILSTANAMHTARGIIDAAETQATCRNARHPVHQLPRLPKWALVPFLKDTPTRRR